MKIKDYIINFKEHIFIGNGYISNEKYNNINFNQNVHNPKNTLFEGSKIVKVENEDELKKNLISTLALHITAYENSFNDNLVNGVNEGLKQNIVIKNHVFVNLISAIQNPFEYPRQQENGKAKNPEIAQYNASQKLLNPNKKNRRQESKKGKVSETKRRFYCFYCPADYANTSGVTRHIQLRCPELLEFFGDYKISKYGIERLKRNDIPTTQEIIDLLNKIFSTNPIILERCKSAAQKIKQKHATRNPSNRPSKYSVYAYAFKDPRVALNHLKKVVHDLVKYMKIRIENERISLNRSSSRNFNNDYINFIDTIIEKLTNVSDNQLKKYLPLLYSLFYYGYTESSELRNLNHFMIILYCFFLKFLPFKHAAFMATLITENCDSIKDLFELNINNPTILKYTIIEVDELYEALLLEHGLIISDFYHLLGNNEIGEWSHINEIFKEFKSDENDVIKLGTLLRIYAVARVVPDEYSLFTGINSLSPIAPHMVQDKLNLICDANGVSPSDITSNLCNLFTTHNDLPTLFETEWWKKMSKRDTALRSEKTTDGKGRKNSHQIIATVNPLFLFFEKLKEKGGKTSSPKTNNDDKVAQVECDKVKELLPSNDFDAAAVPKSIPPILPSKILQEKSLSDYKSIILPRLQNIKNDCFLNAGLQYLFSAKDYVLSVINNSINDGPLQQYIMDILMGNESNVRKLRKFLSDNKTLSMDNHEDAAHVVSYILEYANDKQKILFQFKDQKLLKCDCDGGEERKRETMATSFELSASPNEYNTLQTMIDNYCRMTKTTCSMTDGCGNLKLSKHRIYFMEQQKYLIIDLNARGTWYKPNTSPELIDIDKADIENDIIVFGKKIRLISAIHYFDWRNGNGHYITWRRFENKWKILDDSRTYYAQSLPKNLKQFKSLLFEILDDYKDENYNDREFKFIDDEHGDFSVEPIFYNVLFSSDNEKFYEGEGVLEIHGKLVKLYDNDKNVIVTKLIEEDIDSSILESEREMVINFDEYTFEILIKEKQDNIMLTKTNVSDDYDYDNVDMEDEKQNNIDSRSGSYVDFDMEDQYINDDAERQNDFIDSNVTETYEKPDLSFFWDIFNSIPHYSFDQKIDVLNVMPAYKDQLENCKDFISPTDYSQAERLIKAIVEALSVTSSETPPPLNPNICNSIPGFIYGFNTELKKSTRKWTKANYKDIFGSFLTIPYSTSYTTFCPFCLFRGQNDRIIKHLNYYHCWGAECGIYKCLKCDGPILQSRQLEHFEHCFGYNHYEGLIDVCNIIDKGGDIVKEYDAFKSQRPI